MHLLWTVSNWKRTGPVEPSLDLARAMTARGHRVQVACGTRPAGMQSDEPRNDTEDVVSAYALEVASTGAQLHKHAAPWRDVRDVRRLTTWLRAHRPDAIVTTLRNDHGLVARVAHNVGVPVVRLWFGDGEEPLTRRARRALSKTSGVLAFGARPAMRIQGTGMAPERVRISGAPLDIERLRSLSVEPEASEGFRFGIVARMQTHRRFELLWEALQRLRDLEGPKFELFAIGRGTNQQTVAHDPVRDLGLAEVVTFPGYLRGADYVRAVASLDAQLFLVPGSDATCRALREGMALGVPSIATRRGLLPEIVADGVTGLLVDETASSLAAALDTLRKDPERARAMGAAARARADERFDVRAVASQLESLLNHCGVHA